MVTGSNTTTNGQSIYDRPIDVPEEWRQSARDQGWPDGLLERALQLRVNRKDIEYWFTTEQERLPDIAKFLDMRERLMFGTMRVREATWSDDEAVADLYANSPEEIGDWEVTVERSPYPFAQFRLQENVNMQILEDRGIVLAAAAHSGRNALIEGRRLTCHVSTAWRVRKEFRGEGLSNLLRMIGGPACARFGLVSYWYVRHGNYDAVNWIKAVRRDLAEASSETGDLPGLPVTVHHFRAQRSDPSASLRTGGNATGIRQARRSDTRRCVALINRTHRGLDFFRPYSEAFLRQRLDDLGWGPVPDFLTPVYTWQDYFVLEEGGRIVACAGLWDRGKHVREVWRHKETGETTMIEPTALMDWGYAEGREDAMARLLGYLIGVTHELGRHELLAALEQQPALLQRMQPYEPGAETRLMGVDTFHSEQFDIKVNVRRPYTDLAYW